MEESSPQRRTDSCAGLSALCSTFESVAPKILQVLLICRHVAEAGDPSLLPVSPRLASGQLGEICQAGTNVVLRDSDGAVSGKKERTMTVAPEQSSFSQEDSCFTVDLNGIFGHLKGLIKDSYVFINIRAD